MGYNKAEDTIAQINTNVFFKEFTFCKNDFKALDSNKKFEFADNVVWLDDLLFIYQIKERNKESSSDDRNWYNNKVINKGVKQIKSTLKYLTSYPDIKIENEKGHVLNISEASNCNPIRKIIIYSPNDSFPEELRQKRFYESSEVGLIHFMPFFTKHESMVGKWVFLALCTMLTPIMGIPLYLRYTHRL